MKKVLIAFTNAKVGGIQKALISYLNEMSSKEDITLVLFHKYGKLLHEIPSNINVKEEKSDYRFMGMAQANCVTFSDKIKRGIYSILGRLVGQKYVTKLMSKTMIEENEEYDEAISFIHVTYKNSIYGGVPQYILNLKNVKKKICYIHCDYLNAGVRSNYSDDLYKAFDQIICVSNSTREHFLAALPELTEKVIVEPNYIDRNEIYNKSITDPYIYDSSYINCITVARLSKEKGIMRVIEAIKTLSEEKSIKIHYYILGDGSEKKNIEDKIRDYKLSSIITLLGEKENPYRYLRNADFMIVPSYHEAAPVVFQEAIALGIPVLTTRTTSAEEMIGTEHGIVIDNEDEAIKDALKQIINNPNIIIKGASLSKGEVKN